MKLYEITEELKNCIDEDTGEVDIDAIEEWDNKFDAKAEKVVRAMRNYKETEKGLKNEIKRLREKKKAAKNARKSLKNNYLKVQMVKANKTEINTGIGKIKLIEPSRKKVIVTDKDALPDELIKVKRKPDKRKVKEYLKDGVQVEGAKLEKSDSYIRIY